MASLCSVTKKKLEEEKKKQKGKTKHENARGEALATGSGGAWALSESHGRKFQSQNLGIECRNFRDCFRTVRT